MLHLKSLTLTAIVLLISSMTLIPSVQADERRVIQEDIEWCDIWLPHLNEHKLPRVLLIGDSITRAYYKAVEKRLEGKAYVGRIATSRSIGDPHLIKELDTVLKDNQFDVIHFNNGMHGWGYTEAEYKQFFPELFNAISQSQPKAKLIWGSITPVRVSGDLANFEARTERVKARNAIALEFAMREAIPIDDLFQIGEQHADFYTNDGVHFNEKGTAALAEKVSSAIAVVLEK